MTAKPPASLSPLTSSRLRLKICGVKTVDQALAAESAGADWIGLNFVEGSPRRIDLETATAIVKALHRAEPVGLFVNATPDQIRESMQAIGASIVQLHGEEPPETIKALSDYRVIKAFRLGENRHLRELSDYWRRTEALGHPLHAILIDAWVADRRGGAGALIAESCLRNLPDLPVPWILAGGLNASNLASQVSKMNARPWMVDAASGVESSPGVKCAKLMRDFVQSARDCDNMLSPAFSDER